jgi:hypothetical protein
MTNQLTEISNIVNKYIANDDALAPAFSVAVSWLYHSESIETITEYVENAHLLNVRDLTAAVNELTAIDAQFDDVYTLLEDQHKSVIK